MRRSTSCARAASGALPHEFPPWPTVYHHHSRWRPSGTRARINAGLRERHRRAIGRDAQPSAAIIDSQSVRTTEVGGPRGYDGAKKISGRKRQVLVDTQGNLLKAKVHPAGIRPMCTIGAAPSCCCTISRRSFRGSRCSGPTAPTRD